MFNKVEKVFAISLLILCAIVGIAGYSSSRTSLPPKKVWFDTAGGDVIFDHAYHGALAECSDCHHDYEEGASDTEMNCRACHYYGEARELKSEDQTHTRFIGANCIECHKSASVDVACETCHIRAGFAFEESGRIMPPLPDSVKFETDGGDVNFDHKLHISKDADTTCNDCHHEFKDGKGMEGLKREKNCRTCHYKLADYIPEHDNENHGRYIGVNCAGCHEADDCDMCHQD